jgi:PKD repeat protein
MGGSLNHRDSVRFNLGDGTIITSDTFTHVYASNGTYTVTEIAYNSCGIDSITKQVTVTSVGISVINPGQTRLYPNPAQNSVNLDVSGAATIGLVAANGTLLWDSPKQITQSGTYVFDISRYAAGLYYMVV